MKNHSKFFGGSFLLIVIALFICSDALALTYTNANLEAMLCFRKLSAPNPFDLEVNIGSITNYTSLPIGATVTITQYNLGELTNAMGDATFESVEFSVTAAASEGEPNGFAFPLDTMWVTAPRVNPAVQSTPFARASDASLANSGAEVDTIGNQAADYSSAREADPVLNTATAVSIPPGDTTQSCEKYIGPGNNSKLDGTFKTSVENRAANPFINAIVSDLYVDVPLGDPDPANANATTGNVSYLGYFTFNTNGTMTFTRAVTLPARPTLTLTRSGITNIISFPTSSGTTYTISFTNAAGLSAPFTNWPALPGIIGDGQVDSVTNTSSDATRLYQASAHN
jgi:hypothetical protein